ncbi:MAG: RNA-binding protein [Candidatus Bathyarchaeota archaeon]|nr:MAG: RNA-binding protein [Candidatus Bathyarchaeota archaeon]
MERGCRLSVAVPASLVSDVPHLREKSSKIGLIGRAAAIFKVDEIIVFPDLPSVDQSQSASLISLILSYMETPQYLRKRLFKIRPELRYAGILPPLRTPHHPLANRMKDLSVGEHREGVVVRSSRKGLLVDVGVERPILVPKAQLCVNERITVRVVEVAGRGRAVPVRRSEVGEYWGYRVTVSGDSFGRLVKSGAFDLVIATSRYGVPFVVVRDELAGRWKMADRILVAFGAPAEGLREIVMREGVELDVVADFVVNMIPDQGTETVRTEEAVFASLALFHCL